MLSRADRESKRLPRHCHPRSRQWAGLISQTAMSKKGRGGRRTLPCAFTEHGAIMAANVLNSPRAVQMNTTCGGRRWMDCIGRTVVRPSDRESASQRVRRSQRFGLLVYGNPLQARSTYMKKSQADATTARNLEEKFDRGEDLLDYFDVRKARVIDPQSKRSTSKAKFSCPVKRNWQTSQPFVREKSARYSQKEIGR